MLESENKFAFWQSMGTETPERLADFFLNRLGLLSPHNRSAFIASQPRRDDLIERIRSVSSDPNGPLAGVPYVLQDLIDVDELPTRCGAPFQGPFDHALDESSLLQRTLETMGAVLMAKTVPSEFGLDWQGGNPSFGDCPHADNEDWVCGGGAGSCAQAVKKGWVPLAFGLDGVGGVRVPAAFHGLFGFRMDEKALAREGIVPTLPSLESIGWMNYALADLRRTFEALYPRTKLDAEGGEPRGFLLREVGIPIDADIRAGLMNLAHFLDLQASPDVNHQLCLSFKQARESLETIQNRELFSVHKYWIEEYGQFYAAPIIDRIEAGRNCTAKQADHAAGIQQTVHEGFAQFFNDFDYLVMPISPRPTPDKAKWSHQLEDDLVHLNAPASLAFLPTLILPFQCHDGRHSAAQLIIHPARLRHVPKILRKIRPFYD